MAKTTFLYDTHGRLRETRYYNNDRQVRKTLCAYDDAGKLREEVRRTAAGDFSGKTEYVYDQRGYVVETVDYQSDGFPSSRMVSCYDDSGKLLEVAFCGGGRWDGLVRRRDGGQVVVMATEGRRPDKESICGDALLLSRFVFTYDEQGADTTVTQYGGDGTLTGKKVIARGDKSQWVVISQYDAAGILRGKEDHVRGFDAHGNWIKDTKFLWRITTGAKEPVEVIYRDITYY